MNTKKNKNKSKQTKPANPVPKTEIPSPKTDNTDSVENKSKEVPEITKPEERVPEIMSERVTPSMVETKSPEGDTPKKPKRNRGKKKKSETEDEIDNEKRQKDSIIKVKKDNVIETKKDNVTEAPKELPLDTTKIAPDARKKKNKNDEQENTEYQKSLECLAAQPLKVTMLTKNEAENIMSDVKIVTCVPIAAEGLEHDSKKKKNKKKKRTDSEKSEKEEILACTAAFQKILEPKEDKKDTKMIEQTPTFDHATAEMTSENVSLGMILQETLKMNTEQTETEVNIMNTNEDNKSKKKNKDKKHPPKTGTESLIPEQNVKDVVELSSITTFDKANIAREDFDVASSTEEENNKSTSNTEATKSPRLKAKVAKPVERKSKDLKSDAFIEESCKSIAPCPVVEAKSLCSSDLLPLKEYSEEEAEKKLIKTDIKSEEDVDLKEKGLAYKKEDTPISKESTGKRGKKSPKPLKRVQELKAEENVDLESQKANVCKQKQETAEIPLLNPIKEIEKLKKDIITSEILDETTETQGHLQKDPTPTIFSSESVLKKDETNIGLKCTPMTLATKDAPVSTPTVEEILEQKSIINEEKSKSKQEIQKDKPKEAEVETFQHIPSPDGGMGKKRRKSPKFPRKHDIIQESKDTSKESSKSTEDFNENLKLAPADLTIFKDIKKATKTDEKKTECQKTVAEPKTINTNPLIASDMTASDSKITIEKYETSSEDIEVRSVRTESESSNCDISPTIHHPRSSSQSADGNNNVLITEVPSGNENTPIGLLESNVPMPAVQESIEMASSQDQPLTTINILREEMKHSKSSDEKTDLKSKMMEVNQDMEGLRRSIEKSLAELSAIRNTEESTEHQFLLAQDKLEQIKHLAIKQQTNIKENVVHNTANTEATLPTFEYCEPTTQHSIPSKTESVECLKSKEEHPIIETPKTPEPPVRKDNKGKGKSKKKGKQDTEQLSSHARSTDAGITTTESQDTKSSKETKSSEKQEQKSEQSQEKGKQQANTCDDGNIIEENEKTSTSKSGQFGPIENFEDALTSSVDDVNKTFEMIADDLNETTQNNPVINITEPTDDTEKSDKDKTDRPSKTNPVSQPKNLLGRPAIPARSNKMDYKKEKNKIPNTDQAKVKIKDSVPIERKKLSKDSQTDNKKKVLKNKTVTGSISACLTDNDEYVYKYSFRRVFLPNACHVCKSHLKSGRVSCSSCNLVSYCSLKHKNDDFAQHQDLCFAVSTITQMKDQKYLYANTANITGHDYRLLRMQMIVSCEEVLKRRLIPCEQEMLLYPRLCADPACREWRQDQLLDCEGCLQMSFCAGKPNHIPTMHQKWCKSYSLYQKLVTYHQVKGRLEPKVPSKVMTGYYQIPDKMNEVLASMYEEKIEISDIQYAALTQVATAPLTAAYCSQLHSQQTNSSNVNGVQKKSTFTVQVVGAELQFEADVLYKWEIFFLHLRPDVTDLKVVLIGPELNSGNLPLDLLGKTKLCENCRLNKRRVIFDFQDKRSYYDYWSSDFIIPDIVCAFNPSIQRCSVFNGKDSWPSTIKCILKQKVPFVVTSYTMNELQRDLARIKECSTDFKIVSEPKYNSFASVRPDRNFISDDEMPLLFRNYCYMVICGAF